MLKIIIVFVFISASTIALAMWLDQKWNVEQCDALKKENAALKNQIDVKTLIVNLNQTQVVECLKALVEFKSKGITECPKPIASNQ
jgi:hypothetical protein